MGIPSYFSYIVKNHPVTLQKYNKINVQRFYMDCNSILYDVFRTISLQQNYECIEKELLEKTCAKIEWYILQICPTELVYIAFDGVAPFAKMEQQKTRRYKSWFETNMLAKLDKTTVEPTFVSSSFTPGTPFMRKLSKYVREYFNGIKKRTYRIKELLIATPDQAGEGEHKLFEHLRKHTLEQDQSVAVYGLDADLMMLSLFHLSYGNIYIIRETPEFVQKTIDQEGKIDDLYVLNMNEFARSISLEMDCTFPDPHRVLDYVFLCFFLGNDFLPHFPSLNIRTHGIQRLLDIYREHFGKFPNRFLFSNTPKPMLQWKEVARIIREIAKLEDTFVQQEYAFRKKWDQYKRNDKKTTQDKLDYIQQVPILQRGVEHFIQPNEEFWEERYYHALFPSEEKKNICVNYLEGLEWVSKYYMEGCIDWRWKYHYMYPPLWKDLVSFLPSESHTFFSKPCTRPFRPTTQLMYVLPPPLHEKLLPPKVYQTIQNKYRDCYVTSSDFTFQWAFCRYLWEAHIDLPHIPMSILDQWELLTM